MCVWLLLIGILYSFRLKRTGTLVHQPSFHDRQRTLSTLPTIRNRVGEPTPSKATTTNTQGQTNGQNNGSGQTPASEEVMSSQQSDLSLSNNNPIIGTYRKLQNPRAGKHIKLRQVHNMMLAQRIITYRQ